MYYRKFKSNIFTTQTILHISTFTFVLTPIIIAELNPSSLDEAGISMALVYSFSIVSFILFEMLNIYFTYKKKEKNIELFALVVLVTVLSRIIDKLLKFARVNNTRL